MKFGLFSSFLFVSAFSFAESVSILQKKLFETKKTLYKFSQDLKSDLFVLELVEHQIGDVKSNLFHFKQQKKN